MTLPHESKESGFGSEAKETVHTETSETKVTEPVDTAESQSAGVEPEDEKVAGGE